MTQPSIGIPLLRLESIMSHPFQSQPLRPSENRPRPLKGVASKSKFTCHKNTVAHGLALAAGAFFTASALSVSAAEWPASPGFKNGVGARALSLGEAFTGVADDASALYYNPAGLTQMKGIAFHLG